nr:family 16 glycosylhydrolase [Geodermatophilus normandii]
MGSAGVVGGLVSGQDSTPQAVEVQAPSLSEAAHSRWLDAQRASRQTRPSQRSNVSQVPPRRASQSTSAPSTPAPSTPAPSTPTRSTVTPSTPVPTTATQSPSRPAESSSTPAPSTTTPRATTPSAPAPAPTTAAVPAQANNATAAASGFDYVEEFTTPIAPGQWPANGRGPSAYPNYLSYADGTSGKYYPSQVLSVQNGILDWNVRNSMGAAVLPFGYDGFTYGTYTVRMRTDRFPGYHIAFLLWPNTDQWTHEFDGPEGETSSSNPYPAVLQSTNPVRFAPAQTTPVPQSWNDPVFHNYTWQWGPGFAAFYQDGVQVTRVTTNVPTQGMHPVLQVEFSNTLSEGQKPDPSVAGHVQVDRIMYDPSYTIPVPTS